MHISLTAGINTGIKQRRKQDLTLITAVLSTVVMFVLLLTLQEKLFNIGREKERRTVYSISITSLSYI